MIVEDLDEVIPVRADFKGGEITPRAFKRGGRTYTVETVNARWVDRERGQPVRHFSVQAGGDTYYLRLETGEMVWRVEKVVLEG